MIGLIQEIGITILKQSRNSKLLIIGYGSIGKKYRHSAAKFFKKEKIHIFSKHKDNSDLKKFKNIENLNYVILSNRANERMKFFRSFIKKNSTYIFEKPISTDVLEKSQKKKFLEIIKKNKIKIKTGYCLRLNPAVKKLKQIINKKINQIINIKINTRTYLPSWRDGDYTMSVSANKKFGGGVINELSHELDLMLFLFGKPRAVFAKYLNSKSLKIDVEDIVDIIFKFNNRLNLNMHLDFCSPYEKREIEISFKDHSKITLDLINNSLLIQNLKKTVTKNFFLEKNYYTDSQIKKMISISKSKKDTEWMSELLDAIYVLYIIKRIKKSNISEKMVELKKNV